MTLSRFLLLLWIIPIVLIYFHTTDSFDQDLSRHLKLGEIIWQTKEVPKTNLFSYTNAAEPVFNSHWGSQVIFYLVHKSFGVGGLIVLNTIINTVAFGILFYLLVRRSGPLIPSILFVPFLFLLLDRTWVRPEMFGNLFFAIILTALFSPKARNQLKWFLPIISLLWVNLHITWLLGLLGIFIVLLQDVVDRKGIRDVRVVRENVGIFILSVLALLVNPYGHNAIFNTVNVFSKYGYSIVENQSWFFLKDFGFPLVGHIFFGLVILGMSYLVLITNKRKILLGETIILLAVSILTLRFVRNEILFAYSAFFVSCINLKQFKPLIRVNFPRFYTGIISTAFFLLSTYLIITFHTGRGLPVGVGNKETYRNGVDFFLTNNLEGPIFNNFDIGGYLIYRLYPKERVFVDNRPEAYPVSFFQDVYIPMQINKDTFKKLADQYGIKTIIWGRRDITPWSRDFLTAIAKDTEWQLLYIDEATIIYQK